MTLDDIKRKKKTGNLTSGDIDWLITELELCQKRYDRLQKAVNSSMISVNETVELINKGWKG